MAQIEGLSPTEYQALEALFAQDLPDGKLAKIPPKVAKTLISLGYAEEAEIIFGKGAFAVKVKAHKITLPGHFAYCTSCADVVDPDEEDAEKVIDHD